MAIVHSDFSAAPGGSVAMLTCHLCGEWVQGKGMDEHLVSIHSKGKGKTGWDIEAVVDAKTLVQGVVVEDDRRKKGVNWREGVDSRPWDIMMVFWKRSVRFWAR